MDKLSVICPTMWMSSCFLKLIDLVCSEELVDEFIIINNNVENTPKIKFNDKVKFINNEKNIGVNPSWNVGVNLSKNKKIAILNDDILFDNKIFKYIIQKIDESTGMIGIDINSNSKILELCEVINRPFGFACMFFINKDCYKTIPDDLKIYFGDDWLFEINKLENKKNYSINGLEFSTEMSTTSRYFTRNVIREKLIYDSMIDKIKNKKMFSIIVPHYDQTISDKVLERGINSLKNQTFTDFEVLIYHDGPISRQPPSVIGDYKFIQTEVRHNDWGHSSRDLGIKESNGKYILHFNPDNILYPTALEEIFSVINDEKYRKQNNDIIVFPIYLMGYTANGFYHTRYSGEEQLIKIPLTGHPAKLNFIDCMQLVMKKDKWIQYGGWYDKSFAGDGNMYERFVLENGGARYCNNILGEHW